MGKGQELLDAAREGDRKTVEKILGQITKRSGPFTSLRRGAGVNVQDDNGYTPLHHACLRGHKEIVRLLLSVDASPCIVDKKGATPLHLAAWKGDSEVVSMLLAHNNPPVNIDQLTSDHETALVIAAQFGNVDVVAQLLSRGANVNIGNIKDETALDLAAQYGRLDTVQHLLRARPNLVDPYKIPLCRGRMFASTPLHRASKNGHKEVVSTLIAAGIDPNVRTANGTALHEAANNGKASVVRVLLAKRADLNIVDRRGRTVHDLLNEYSEEATKRVRRIISEHMAMIGYESEEDVPPFPVQDYSPTGYSNTVGMEAHETHKNNIHDKSLSSSPSILTKPPHNVFTRLFNKLGIKGKFNSAPDISNPVEPDVTVRSNLSSVKSKSTKFRHIGNSTFFNPMINKNDSGTIDCTDEFDTVSLEELANIQRNAPVNRSNRSCPGFKNSLPNIAEIVESASNSNESLTGSVKSPTEAINHNPQLSIFEPRESNDHIIKNTIISAKSENKVNECYEPYDFSKNNSESSLNKLHSIPKPSPRPTVAVRKISNESTIYENLDKVKTVVPPIPAARNHILINANIEKRVNYENIIPKPEVREKPEPPKRTILPQQIQAEVTILESSPSGSRSSTLSSDSMLDEANFEDILLSKKSTSFKRADDSKPYTGLTKSSIHRSQSITSDSSNFTEASAIDNVDCSTELDEKSMYLSMTGTLPNKKTERAVKKKVLFRHKTFTNIEINEQLSGIDIFKRSNDLAKDTLANYHIRGTGHCIYQAPTVEEFIYVFNRETLYKDVPPFDKVPNKRESYYETAICFCKPRPPKFHKSAEDLLAVVQSEDKVMIDVEALKKNHEMHATSFQCFCDEDNCTYHFKNRAMSSNLVVKFSAIKKSISTPDITLDSSPVSTTVKPLNKNKSVPLILDQPYAVVELKDIIKRNNSTNSDTESASLKYETISQPSTLSTCSRPYSVKDIAEVISIKDTSDTSLISNASEMPKSLRTSCSGHSGQWSLHTCNSNVTIKSDMSFKSCLEDQDSSDDDGTLHSDGDISDTDTVRSEVDSGWVHSDSYGVRNDVINELDENNAESGIEMSPGEQSLEFDVPNSLSGLLVASLDGGPRVGVRSGSGRRQWDEAEGTSEGDALSVSSAASSCAPHHLLHHHEYSKVSPTPPKKPPRRNLSVSPTHANSPSSAYSYERARSQDDLDEIQGSKHYLKHGRSIDQYVDGKLSYSEYEENHNSPRVAPIPHPRAKNRAEPVAIPVIYNNVRIKEQNPRRKLKRNNFGPQYENYEPRMMNDRTRRRSGQERSSLESLLDDSQSMNSPSDCDVPRIDVPLSPTHYEQPPTPDHPPPSARQAENSIHERIRPLSQRIMEVIEEIRIRKKSQGDIITETT